MPKKTILVDQHVRVWPRENGFFGESSEAEILAECQRLAREINKHCSDFAGCRVWNKKQDVCIHCGSKWDPNCTGDYNGGCCDEDEKNNPEATSASNNS